MAAKTKTEKIRGEFEGKYGAPKDPSKKVLIGMKGGKAVYGDEWDEVTPMENEITNTYSQNQAELGRVTAELNRSGGIYNPSPNDITRMENKYPSDAKDTQNEIKRVGASTMVGSDSPAAISARENPTQDAANARFLATLQRNAAEQKAQRDREVRAPSTIAAPSIQRESYAAKKSAVTPPAVTPPAVTPAAVPASSSSTVATPAGSPLNAVASDFLNTTGYPTQQAPPSTAVEADKLLDDYGFDVLTGQRLPQYTSPFPVDKTKRKPTYSIPLPVPPSSAPRKSLS